MSIARIRKLPDGRISVSADYYPQVEAIVSRFRRAPGASMAGLTFAAASLLAFQQATVLTAGLAGWGAAAGANGLKAAILGGFVGFAFCRSYAARVTGLLMISCGFSLAVFDGLYMAMLQDHAARNGFLCPQGVVDATFLADGYAVRHDGRQCFFPPVTVLGTSLPRVTAAASLAGMAATLGVGLLESGRFALAEALRSGKVVISPR